MEPTFAERMAEVAAAVGDVAIIDHNAGFDVGSDLICMRPFPDRAADIDVLLHRGVHTEAAGSRAPGHGSALRNWLRGLRQIYAVLICKMLARKRDSAPKTRQMDREARSVPLEVNPVSTRCAKKSLAGCHD